MKKKLLLVALAAVAVAIATELGAYTLLSFDAGRPMTHLQLRQLQDRLAEKPESEPEEGEPKAAEWTDFAEQRADAFVLLHPYLGFIPDPARLPERSKAGLLPAAGELGFPYNGTDPLAPKAEGELVIGIFGGSFALNFGNRADLLRRALEGQGVASRTKAEKVRVVVAAAGGQKQPQALMALNYLLALGADFDVVLNIDGFNEVALPAATNVPFSYSPYFPRAWPLLVGKLDPQVRRLTGEITFLTQRRSERAKHYRDSALRYSWTAGLLWLTSDRRAAFEITELARQREALTPASELQATGPTRHYSSDAELYDDLVAVWSRSSRQMDALCKARGIRYLHFLQPNQYVPDSKRLTAKERAEAYRADHPYRPAVLAGYPKLRVEGAKLASAGIRFYDLSMLFSDVDATVYRDACCHINQTGLDILAHTVAQALAEPPAEAELTR